ncbi:hypothetical protein GUJ93_ZPchr0014g47087 [Zizania palustris]|uniref:mitogen-activated protein kinase kinase kinase n=1 Tax=Zizania palustris TaxID=103762 RepID=A0A8J5VSL1_ZIZPA|nr:hypothetical protein GUJ93_ZPchr0014g47087 [Zizania palustris]
MAREVPRKPEGRRRLVWSTTRESTDTADRATGGDAGTGREAAVPHDGREPLSSPIQRRPSSPGLARLVRPITASDSHSVGVRRRDPHRVLLRRSEDIRSPPVRVRGRGSWTSRRNLVPYSPRDRPRSKLLWGYRSDDHGDSQHQSPVGNDIENATLVTFKEQVSPGSGQTSGHNSVGGDMLAQLFWQPSRGSPECSPIPSPRMTSPGPSSRVHSGSVSPLHPSPGRSDNPPSPGSRWKKGKLIGRGTFGHVYVGFNNDSGEMCAMKEVTLFMDDPKSKESAKQLGQEITLLSRLQHPNIVQYYGSETVDDKLYIYLELVSGGSIHKLLQEYGQLGEPAIRSYTQQILSGLAYLHAKNTVHRDIKGANILVDPSGRVKLADFGMAKHINGHQCPFSFKGSPYWMAPEVIKNSNGCNLAVDIWSLGCTVLEMATSKPPWSQYEGIAAMFKIGNSRELPPIPDHLSEQGKDFIRKCLQRDPSQRPTAVELLQHPFMQKAASLEKSVLSDPLEHLAVTKVAGHTRNISSLGFEGQTIYQRRGAKFSSKHRYSISQVLLISYEGISRLSGNINVT